MATMATTTPQELQEFENAWAQDQPDGQMAMQDAQKAAEVMQAQEQAVVDYSSSWTKE